MLSNAMWFSVAPESENNGIQYGYITLSYEEAAIGFLTNVITFPIVFFIVFLFKYSKARVLRENRLLIALIGNDSDEESEDEEDEDCENYVDFDEDNHMQPNGSTTTRPSSSKSTTSSNSDASLTDSVESNKFSLPYYCTYIGWLLCFLCIGSSIFFLWGYGITFGNDKTHKWLSSLVFSFFTNFCVFEPLKVNNLVSFL